LRPQRDQRLAVQESGEVVWPGGTLKHGLVAAVRLDS
jgi:hypothetical protein